MVVEPGRPPSGVEVGGYLTGYPLPLLPVIILASYQFQ